MSTEYRCGDCSVVVPVAESIRDHTPRLRHEQGCPVGDAVTAILADDLAWFQQHPFTPYRFRSAGLVELIEMAGAGGYDPLDPGPWNVLVQRDPSAIVRGIGRRDGGPVLWVATDLLVVPQ